MFKQGEITNPKGRPAGSQNRSSESIRTMLTNFIKCNLETIQKDYDSLSPNNRLIFIEKLLKYSIPSLQSVDMHQFVKKEVEQLSDDQVNELAEKILQTAN